ncbi:PAS domain S-box protein [Sulfurimonas indica]|uniref:PAS domain S-box protein n=1 Tax=Sulfurimonas indica TaxID=2508707 RepID=UPI0012652D33|nr:PAS domain S-box protein [Sulfurimonas indica]
MKNFIYVGIGASAGGLQALKKLVSKLPGTFNYVYIIAQHLDPNKKSSLTEILTKYANMPVETITQNTKYSANHIYIIPPGHNIIYKKHHLYLQKTDLQIHNPTPSVDKLFEALALYKKQDSIGIILTGSGHDGTQGIKTIKEYSGITIAQLPQEAYCKSMPQSAIESHMIDYILTIDEIAEELTHSLYTKLPAPFKKIQNLLHTKEKFNIEKYKNETILRRINKRMLLVNVNTLDEYLAYLNEHPNELHLLYQNILIGVTEFFRDPEAFDALEDEIYIYLKDKPDGYILRLWSIACSTGEEAYSLAILVSKVSEKLNKEFDVHIFATDIDDKALERARNGIYSAEAVQKIDKNILSKYFIKINNDYKIVEKIRKQIIFTKHNILNEPPFINQDIISCRNLLIYILPEVQQEIFTLLHYVLKDKGILFLGSSESTLTSIRYFVALNSQYKIYMKERLENPPKISSHYFSKHLEENNKALEQRIHKKDDLNIEHDLEKNIFDFFAPNCIVIDHTYNIVYKKGSLPFLHIPDGFISLNILDNLHQSLRYDVNRIIKQAFRLKNTQKSKFIEITLENKEKCFIRIIASPYKKESSRQMLFLYFQLLSADELQFNTADLKLPDESFVIKSLTTQLAQIQEENRLLSDELIVTKENMQLLNEELQSSNEELQSSNEELETSNEELQSSNEELHISILNEQKLQQQLSSILNATQDGIIGLDLQGNHTFVNDAAINILGFSKDELLNNNAHKLWHHTKPDGSNYPFEECTLHNHLINKESIRTEDLFWKKDGTPINVEVLQNPIVEDGKLIGAVLSFHDITEKIKLKKIAEHEHRLAELYMNIVGTLVMTLDIDGNITMINKEGAKLLGLSQNAVIGRNWFETFISSDIRNELKNMFDNMISGLKKLVVHHTNKIIDINGEEHLISWTNNYTRDINNNITGIISSGIDITKEEELSKKLFEQEHLYKLTFEEADIGIAHTTLDGTWIDTNEYMSHLLGYTKHEFQQMTVSQITHEDDKHTDQIMMQQLLDKDKNSYHIEKRYIHKNGDIIWVSLSVVVLKDENKNPLYFLKIIRDISQLKLLMYQLETEKERFEKIIDFTPIPLMLYKQDGEIILLNKVFTETTGYTQEEILTIDELITQLFRHENAEKKSEIKQYYKNPLKKIHEQQTIITKSGGKRIGILNAVSLDNWKTTQTIYYLIAIVDITDLQKKDELMIAQSRQAAMGDMLTMIAHQWRQPLSVISMLANNLKVKKELHEEITQEDISHLIVTLNKQTDYLSHTIDDFRDFFKPDKIKEKTSIDAILKKTTTLVEKSLEDNNIKLEISSHPSITITTYPNQLIQTIINLINNAKDAIKEHTPNNGLIKISVSQEKDNVKITICDNGGGIDPDIIDKIGQPYVTTKSKNGTGLGLYMSIIIISKHLGGTLEWQSDNIGSCFDITLPNN